MKKNPSDLRANACQPAYLQVGANLYTDKYDPTCLSTSRGELVCPRRLGEVATGTVKLHLRQAAAHTSLSSFARPVLWLRGPTTRALGAGAWTGPLQVSSGLGSPCLSPAPTGVSIAGACAIVGPKQPRGHVDRDPNTDKQKQSQHT